MIETAPATPPVRSLRTRAILAAKWTLFGFVGANVLRVCNNLVMTRLLFPEAFGLMSIVTSVLVGVNMLSDLGVSESIVRSVRGEQASYVNTAWTIQIVRGGLMALVLIVAAGPIAGMYHQPELRYFVMMAGLNAAISGFMSTKTALADRKLQAGRITLIDLGVQTIALAGSMLYAYFSPTPWALIWGTILGASAKLAASHLLLDGPRNRLHWDRSEAKSILSFGLWITLSSTLSFFAGEGNRLVLAKVMSIRLVGLVGLSNALSLMAWSAAYLIGSRVFYPAYAEILRTRPERFKPLLLRARMAQVLPFWALSVGLVLLGPSIIRLMYDARYADAGLILQIQVMGMMVAILYGSYSGVLMSMGRVDLNVWLLAATVGCQMGGTLLGSFLGGHFGAILGSSASVFGIYTVHSFVYRKLDIWFPRFDAAVMSATLAVMLAFYFSGRWRIGLTW